MSSRRSLNNSLSIKDKKPKNKEKIENFKIKSSEMI